MAMVLVRFTRCTVNESFCRQAVTSNSPGPATVTGGVSFAAHCTAFARRRPWSGARTSQNVRSRSPGK